MPITVGGLPLRAALAYLRRNRLRILMYHALAEAPADPFAVRPARFAAQMQYLADHRLQVVSLQEGLARLRRGADLRRRVVLTFDDGLRDFLTTALPVLQRYGLPATLFVVPGCYGQTARWSRAERGRPLLSAAEVAAVQAAGVALGSHTMTHADLPTLDATALAGELTASYDALAATGATFIPFAYPGGRFTRRERAAVAAAGYDCAVIVGGRWGNGPETDRFLLKREPMLQSDSLAWFARRVGGFYEAHYLLARARGVATR
jgi:peptidoglycan/xylan/chitin deacetylase (PgdA/CDA1 family)